MVYPTSPLPDSEPSHHSTHNLDAISMGSLSAIVFAIFTLLSVRAIRLSSISMAPKGTTFDLAAALSSPTAPKITDFDRKVYEACSRVPAGELHDEILLYIRLMVYMWAFRQSYNL